MKVLKSGSGRLKRRVREDVRMKGQSDTSNAAGLEGGERDQEPILLEFQEFGHRPPFALFLLPLQ